jgi:hypothetical protein
MILVAGLAVAGLAGIAAAFYFSIRPGSSRAPAAGPGQAGADRLPESRSRTAPGSSDRPARSASSARPPGPAGRPASRTGPRPVADGSAGSREDQGRPASGHRTPPAVSPARTRTAGPPAEPGPGRHAPAARPHAAPAPAASVPVPAMAADGMNGTPAGPRPGSGPAARPSPVAGTADAVGAAGTGVAPRSRRRVGWHKAADVDEELWPAEAFGGVTDEQFWDDLAADKPLATTARTAQPDSGSGRRRPTSTALPDGRPEGSGAYLRSRPGPADRTAIRPSRAAARPSSTATQPSPTAAQPNYSAAQPSPDATRPSPVATRPNHAARQPADSRGRSHAAAADYGGTGISVDEDPLTSPAYSLRPKGPVGCHSHQPSRGSRDLSWEQYEAVISQSTQPYNGPIQLMNTPPYGEAYGRGNPGDSGRPNGTWSHVQQGSSGRGGSWAPRHAYRPASGYRDPYDP